MMTVDEALHFAWTDRGPAKGRNTRALAATMVLAAEVRRLRKELAELNRAAEKTDVEQSPGESK